MMKPWFFLLFGGIISFSGAAAAECLKADEIAKISADFSFVVKNKKIKVEACTDNPRLSQIYTSLINLRNYPAQARVHDKFDANIITPDPYGFLAQRVHTIILVEPDQKEDCEVGTDAFVNPDRRSQKEIYLCPEISVYDWFTTGAVLIHEARHMNGYPHIACPNDAETLSCDIDYKLGGSYGTETEYFFKAARNPGLHPALRSQAYATAATNLFSHFVRKPFGTVGGSLVKTSTGQLLFHHDSQMEDLQTSIAPEDLVISKNGSALVYQTAEKTVAEIDLLGANKGREATASPELQRLLEKDSDSILDAVLIEDDVCLLTARFVRCSFNEKRMEYPITGFKPLQLLLVRQSSIINSGSITVSAEDGYLYQISRKGQWIRSAKKMDIKSTQGVGAKKDLVLLLNGKTAIFDGQKKSWSYPAEFQGISVDKIVTPYSWSKELSEL